MADKATETPEVKPEPAAEAATPAAEAAPATKVAPAAAAATTAKVPKVVVIVLAVIVGLFILGFLVTAGASYFLGRQILSGFGITNVIPGLNGSKTVTMGTGGDQITVSDTQQWPPTMPAAVPKFSGGRIVGTTRIAETWSVSIEGVSKAQVDAYRANLVSKGWTVGDEVNFNTTESWTASLGTLQINPIFESKDGTLLISVYTVTS